MWRPRTQLPCRARAERRGEHAASPSSSPLFNIETTRNGDDFGNNFELATNAASDPGSDYDDFVMLPDFVEYQSPPQKRDDITTILRKHGSYLNRSSTHSKVTIAQGEHYSSDPKHGPAISRQQNNAVEPPQSRACTTPMLGRSTRSRTPCALRSAFCIVMILGCRETQGAIQRVPMAVIHHALAIDAVFAVQLPDTAGRASLQQQPWAHAVYHRDE